MAALLDSVIRLNYLFQWDNQVVFSLVFLGMLNSEVLPYNYNKE